MCDARWGCTIMNSGRLIMGHRIIQGGSYKACNMPATWKIKMKLLQWRPSYSQVIISVSTSLQPLSFSLCWKLWGKKWNKKKTRKKVFVGKRKKYPVHLIGLSLSLSLSLCLLWPFNGCAAAPRGQIILTDTGHNRCVTQIKEMSIINSVPQLSHNTKRSMGLSIYFRWASRTFRRKETCV